MFAIIMIVAGLVFALLGAAVAKRTAVEGVPAKKKPDGDTEPRELQLELSLQRSSALRIEHELDNPRDIAITSKRMIGRIRR